MNYNFPSDTCNGEMNQDLGISSENENPERFWVPEKTAKSLSDES